MTTVAQVIASLEDTLTTLKVSNPNAKVGFTMDEGGYSDDALLLSKFKLVSAQEQDEDSGEDVVYLTCKVKYKD